MLRRILYRNFCQLYKISNWTRHRLTPMGGLFLGGVVASGIFGVDTRQSLSFQVFAITSALLLLAFIQIFTFRGKFKIQRRLPEFATTGQKVNYQVTLTNRSKSIQRDVVIYDELDVTIPGFSEFTSSRDTNDKYRNWYDRLVGYPRMMGLIQHKRGGRIEPAQVDELPPDDEIDVQLELYPSRRGYIHFKRFRIGRADPLGLMRALKSRPDEDSLLVLPRTYDVPAVNLQGKRKYQQGGMTLASSVGDSQEFMSLRDYKPGDPLRAIHWRSYAKKGRPVVKEFQDEFFVRQGLLLDTFIEDKHADVFEEAVSLAASFIVASRQQDSLLDLMFVGTESYRFTSGRGMSQVENMLEILACVSPCHEPKINELEELILNHTVETSGLICVMLDLDEKRRRLIKSVISMDIPVVVLLVTAASEDMEIDTAFMGNYSNNLHIINTTDIQAQLNRLQL